MRFSTCLHLVQTCGFFLGQTYVSYRRPWAGSLSQAGAGLFFQGLAFKFGDGFFLRKGRAFKLVGKPTKRQLNLGLRMLHLAAPNVLII
jgi:hypothetical protein